MSRFQYIAFKWDFPRDPNREEKSIKIKILANPRKYKKEIVNLYAENKVSLIIQLDKNRVHDRKIKKSCGKMKIKLSWWINQLLTHFFLWFCLHI